MLTKETDLAGITSLMNPQHIKSDANLEEAESKFVKMKDRIADEDDYQESSLPSLEKEQDADDIIDIYSRDITDLKKKLGIDFGDIPEELEKSSVSPRQETKSVASIEQMVQELDLKFDSKRSEMDRKNLSLENSPPEPSRDQPETEDYNDFTDDEDLSDDDISLGAPKTRKRPRTEVIAGLEKELGLPRGFIDSKLVDSRSMKPINFKAPPLPEEEPGQSRDSGERRRQIDTIMGEFRGDVSASANILEQEKVRDTKSNRIDQIIQLKMELEESGVNCDKIEIPTVEDKMDTIDSILRVLHLKNDRMKYSGFAEEIAVSLAEGVEEIFDGKREFPIIGAPDYTNYHNTVALKMYRMRHETAQVVGGIIQKYNISPGWRIFLELLPSFVFYPKQRKRQKQDKFLSNDASFNEDLAAQDAYRNIRSSEKDIEDIKNI